MSDGDMLRLTNLIQEGAPDDISAWPVNLKIYHRFRNELTTIGGVILYKARVLIPVMLRKEVLRNLHSAHQGVSSMMARAESSVFWPGISQDIKQVRERCAECNRMAPSQPSMPPKPLLHPEYPFELVCADYFMYKGHNYLVIVDRYSNWPTVIKTEDLDARTLIKALKNYSMIFGIPAEVSSDGGPQFIASSTQKFFKDWGIHHRVSSVAYPHSNCRAELAVKTMKRLITSNVRPNGSLDNDLFRRAVMQYKNTPDSQTKLSPAQIVHGRQLRDFTPSAPGNLKQAQVWNITAEYRELALAKRHAKERERLAEHTRTLEALRVGDHSPRIYTESVRELPTKMGKVWDCCGSKAK